LLILILAVWAGLSQAQESGATERGNSLDIRRVIVDGRTLSPRPGAELRVGPSPQNIVFITGTATNWPGACARFRHKLEGRDTTWVDHPEAEMYLAVRFYDEEKKLLDLRVFTAKGESAGWTGSLKDSRLTHRRETLVVPRETSSWNVVISSAGPPDTVGIFVVDNLTVSRLSSANAPAEILLQTPLEGLSEDDIATGTVPDWLGDGIRPSMAKIVEIGENPKKRAFAVIDDDPRGHAEWRARRENMKPIAPADRLIVEWNEMFSMGKGLAGSGQEVTAAYHNLPPGPYRFFIEEVNILGVPTGVEASLAVRVRSPLWQTAWFWAAVAAVLISASAVVSRSVASKRMRREVLRLTQLRALEQERLRIARNIHDDLGARVTQISMLSAMAPDRSSFPQNARTDFNRISQMSRDLVSALYETVWAVNPENDNLYAMGNYLRQVTGQLCESAHLRCRFDIPSLPRELQVSSQTRHNVAMAVKEAVHNVMKHASASELTIRVDFTGGLLTVSIRDNGCGFQTSGLDRGNGLANMKRRMEDLGGSCIVESQTGGGTCVQLRLELEALEHSHSQKAFPDDSQV
jgi:signal transduction histidine kinase